MEGAKQLNKRASVSTHVSVERKHCVEWGGGRTEVCVRVRACVRACVAGGDDRNY